MRFRDLIHSLLGALLLLSNAALARAGDDDESEGPVVWASAQVQPGRPTVLQIMGRGRDANIVSALARIGGQPPDSTRYGGDWTSWRVGLPAPSRHGLVVHQLLPLDPLLEALRAQGEPSLSLVIQHPPAGFARLAGAKSSPMQRGTLSATVATSTTGQPLSFEFGWRSEDIAGALAWLLLALVAPILGAIAIDRRSAARDRTPERWFFRMQAIQLVTIGGWVAWMIAIEASRVLDLVEFAFGMRGLSRAVLAPVSLMGFLPAALSIGVMSRRVVRRLRGFDPPAGPRLATFRALLLLSLLALGIGGFVANHPRLGAFALLGTIGLAVLWPAPRGPLGLTPQSLSSGALRDRLFDLAHRAGVKLRELYVVPMRRQRMANAFAVHGGAVMVADELLDRMSRREVDAVLAHEISHLEHSHPIKSLLAGVVAYGLLAGAAASLRLPYGFSLAIVALWLTQRYFARRFELAADAGAAALTGDPEALISGLGRLASLNQMPLAWGRRWGWLITHPTTEARARAIGRRAGVAVERVTELLERGLPSAERYGERERPGEQPRVFSTAWKTATMGRLGLAILATSVAAPAAAVALARALGSPLPHVAVVAAGAALALLAMLILQDALGALVVSGLEPRLRQSMDDGASEAARFVALSPGDRARIYEGFLDWDLGLLTLEPDHLSYRGEQVTLRVPRAAVRAIEVGAAAPSWLSAPRVIVRWTGPGGEEAIALRAADCRTVRGIAPASRALAERLDRWRSSLGAPVGAGAPLGLGAVTARTPREAAAPRDLPLVLTLLGALSAGASFALGLGLSLGLDVFGAALLGVIALRWPMMTARESSGPRAGARESERRAA